MTNKEKAIIMAHTGICMLAGEDFDIYHEYIQEIMGRPVYTHELAEKSVMDEIVQKSRSDFIMLCKKKEADSRMEEKPPVFEERESTQAIDYADGSGEMKIIRYADWLCPVCGWFVGERYIPRMHSQQKSDFCSRCGQAIDWTKISREEREAADKRMRELEQQNKRFGENEDAEEMQKWKERMLRNFMRKSER